MIVLHYEQLDREEPIVTTVLVVNREEGAVARLKDYLEADGLRVVIARDGPAGLDLAHRESPPLILLDLMPPAPAGCSTGGLGWNENGMDGCEFLRRLRRESKAGVIVVSRRDDVVTEVAALESGADVYLRWPCSRLELLARIRALLRRADGGEYAVWQNRTCSRTTFEL